MSDTHRVVDDSERTQGATRGLWKPIIDDVLVNRKTVFVPRVDANRVSNSLTQAARTRSELGLRVHRRSRTIDNEEGMIFWAEPRKTTTS